MGGSAPPCLSALNWCRTSDLPFMYLGFAKNLVISYMNNENACLRIVIPPNLEHRLDQSKNVENIIFGRCWKKLNATNITDITITGLQTHSDSGLSDIGVLIIIENGKSAGPDSPSQLLHWLNPGQVFMCSMIIFLVKVCGPHPHPPPKIVKNVNILKKSMKGPSARLATKFNLDFWNP